jgi:hypothetical protein
MPPTNVNGERMHTHTKPEEHPQMGHRHTQKQQGLPGEMGTAPKLALIRTQGHVPTGKTRGDY